MSPQLRIGNTDRDHIGKKTDLVLNIRKHSTVFIDRIMSSVRTKTRQEHYYRKELPNMCTAFNSKEGKQIFREALDLGHMECYFNLAAQFRTQDEPAYCSLSTLVMVLNTLQIDPKQIWKGVWRWYHEDMLSCCLPLESIQTEGIFMEQFACLAGCNTLLVKMVRATPSTSIETFRDYIRNLTKVEDQVIVVNYSRPALDQTGTGHYSPIGGYHPEKDLVLILDTARFKYPPHWVKLTDLWNGMTETDPGTGLPRGYFILSRNSTEPLILLSISNYLTTIIDNAKQLRPGIIAFIKSWDGWLSEDAKLDEDQKDIILKLGIRKLIESLSYLEEEEYILQSQVDSRCRKRISDEHYHAITRFLESLENTKLYKTVCCELKTKTKDSAYYSVMQGLGAGITKCYGVVTSKDEPVQTNRCCKQSLLQVEHFFTVLLFMWPYDKVGGTNGFVISECIITDLMSSDQVLQNEMCLLSKQMESILAYLTNCKAENT